MDYRKRFVALWIIILVIIIAGAAYWYWSKHPAHSTPPSAVGSQAQQYPSQPSQATQTQTAAQTSAADSPTPQLVTVQNKNGQVTATPTGSNAWQFAVSGDFGLQQDAYVINFGDGTQANLNTCPGASKDNPVCKQFSPVTHTYPRSGTYKVTVSDTFTGAGSESTNTLFVLSLSN